jgi:hypothetical protein
MNALSTAIRQSLRLFNGWGIPPVRGKGIVRFMKAPPPCLAENWSLAGYGMTGRGKRREARKGPEEKGKVKGAGVRWAHGLIHEGHGDDADHGDLLVCHTDGASDKGTG